MPPTIRTQTKSPRLEFPRSSFYLYGEPKVGKTTCAAQFPTPLILNVASENGVTEIAGDVADLHTPADLLEIVHWLNADPEHALHGYQTIILDGISTLCVDSVARSNSRDTRQSVKDATAELRPVLHEYLALPCIRVITGHARRDEKEIMVGDRRAVKITVYPDLPPRLRLFIEGRVDAFGYCFAASGKSQVWWLPLDTETPRPRAIAAGNRLGLPRVTELSYQAIHAALVSSNGNGHKAPEEQA
jgi:hypothetical protein